MSQYQQFNVLSTTRGGGENLEGTPVGNPTNVASAIEFNNFVYELVQFPRTQQEVSITPPLFRSMLERNQLKKCPREVIYETRDQTLAAFNPNKPRNEYVRLGQNTGFVSIDGTGDGYTFDPNGVLRYPSVYFAHIGGFLIVCHRHWKRNKKTPKEFIMAGTGDVLARRTTVKLRKDRPGGATIH